MSFLKYVLSLVVVAGLTACGGGGGSGGAVNGAPQPAASSPTSANTPATVEVLTSSNTLPSAGSGVVITAFVKNGNNVGMAGQSVQFSTNSGTLLVSSSTTDLSGAVTAKLIAGSDKSLRNITVTVTATPASGSIVIPVTDTRISIAGGGSLQVGGVSGTYTVRAVDSSNVGIAGAVISVTSAIKNTISPAVVTTDAAGNATFVYTPNISGNDILTVTGLGANTTSSVVVSAIDFVALNPVSNALIAVGDNQTITVRYKLNGVGVPGIPVSFSTTRGEFSPSSGLPQTDSNGDASSVLSSTTAGPAIVIAQIAGVGQVNLPVQFVATNPNILVLQANPGAVSPNSAGATNNQSSIEAVVRDSNGNAVAGKQVNFTTVTDSSNGSLSPGVATTDGNGRAVVQFIPGSTSTSANGVEIKAVVSGTTISGTTRLTVSGQALFITIGFGNTMTNLDETTYSKLFSVYVTDVNGVAVGNQLLTLSVIPETYGKGNMFWSDPLWRVNTRATCLNEDANRNGVLDLSLNEDTNGNKFLTPGNIAVSAPGIVTTDAGGRATFNLQYGEQFANWATVKIGARASVAGTESSQSILFSLPALASDVSTETVTPAGVISPFGQSTSCTNAL